MNNKLSLTKDQIDELVFNKKSEVKMKDKLKVKVWNYKNVVLYEVLEQDEELRGKGKLFTASNGLKVISCDYPDINRAEIYIKGNEEGTDEMVTNLSFDSTKEAKQLVKEVKQAVKEFNENQREILTDKEKEYLSAVIKPYRNIIKCIRKYGGDYKEFICIKFYDDQDMDMPYFKKDTMYKGMEVDKEYTLEELGL